MTMLVMDVLEIAMNAPSYDPPWGLSICDATGHGPGSVYPVLQKLLKAGWLEDHWEDPQPEDRPRRRFYTITDAGRAAYQEAIASRARRRIAWSGGLRAGETA
jgi:DNA-binding PadR family transcriptional regulator